MMVPEVVTVIVANQLGVFGSTLFAGSIAALPENDGPFTTVREAGGGFDLETQNQVLINDDTGWEQPVVQVVVTGKDYLATASLLGRIRARLRLTNTLVGAYAQNVTSITRAGAVAQVTTPGFHRLYIGQRITVAGAAQPEYNGAVVVATTPTTKTFTYAVTGTPSSPAAGSLTFSYAGSLYRSLRPAQVVIDLGLDASNRVRLAFNARGVKRPSFT